MDAAKLKMLQSLPLDYKVDKSIERIIAWYHYWKGNVAVSFSGGKDSTVLLHLVRSYYPEVPAVFVDTGLEWPEVRTFVKTVENVIWLKPGMSFRKVIEKYGYPIPSKEVAQCLGEVGISRSRGNVDWATKRLYGRSPDGTPVKNFCVPAKWRFLADAPFRCSDHCCKIMKKNPAHKYTKESGRKFYIGTMTVDSSLRKQSWLRYSCNAFGLKEPISRPLSFWKEEDIWAYLHMQEVPYSKIYDMGADRTGCMFCMFGVHLEKGENRFQRMRRTHPAQHRYCMEKLGLRKVLDFINIPCE